VSLSEGQHNENNGKATPDAQSNGNTKESSSNEREKKKKRYEKYKCTFMYYENRKY